MMTTAYPSEPRIGDVYHDARGTRCDVTDLWHSRGGVHMVRWLEGTQARTAPVAVFCAERTVRVRAEDEQAADSARAALKAALEQEQQA